MDKMLNKFKDYLILNGYSTLLYHHLITKFLEEIDVEKISEETIQKFILTKKETSSVETINAYIKAIKVFLKFLKKDIPIPKLFKRIMTLPDSIPLEYFEKNIIPVVECIFTNPLRIKTILYFMYYTGVRKSEIFTLKRNLIDLKKRTAKIYVKKTKEERLVIFPKKVASLLESYFSIDPEQDNAFNLNANTIPYIFGMLKPHFKDIKLRPHLFRHSFATHLLRKGADVTIVQKLLGHKDIKSTMRYLGTNEKLIKEMYDKYIK